jgi:chromosome segregation ATPase
MVRENTLRNITKTGSENLKKAFDEKLQQINTTLNKELGEIKKSSESFGDVMPKTESIRTEVNQTIAQLEERLDRQLSSLDSKTESIRTEVNQTIAQLEERLDRQLSSLDTRVNLLPILRSGEDRLTFRPEQQQPVLDCMYVLNEVEKLTLEKRQNLAQSNTALARKRNDARMQPRLAPLPSALQDRITALLGNFTYTTPDEESKERMERFWDCRDLRRAILEYFASLPPAGQTTQTSQPSQP